jgi:ferric-dicitrate binding protein FerR (iron transport regulator)
MMNLTDKDILELNELCNALVDGTLTDSQKSQLSEKLAAAEEARQFYVRFMGLSASLHEYASEMQTEAPDAVVEMPRLWQRARFLWSFGALAAAFVFAFWLGPVVKPPGAAEAGEFVAQVTGAKDCPLNPGDQIRRGQRLELTRGVVEITFDCGAQVTLDGPAVLDLNSAWDASLERGTLKADVPVEAIGFRISNPAVDVVDLGTEFSLVAGPGGTAELFVLKGKVEATPREQPAILLREQESRRFSPTGSAEIADAPTKFKRFAKLAKLDRQARPANFIHWRLNRTNGEAGAQIPVPGLASNAARTIAFWVQLPSDTLLTDATPMVAWTLRTIGKAGPQPVEIGWNANPASGPLGAVRTEFGRTMFVGTSSVRDGRWHHVAVVFVPHGRNHDKLNVKQYVDGRLDGLTVKTAKKHRRDFPGGPVDETLWLGRSTTGRDGFHGALDELFIADRALVPQEINRLLKTNKPEAQEVADRK